MTIASTVTSIQYPCNGVTTQFSFNNKIFSASDLVVTLKDTLGNLYSFAPSGFNTFTSSLANVSYTVSNIDVDTGCLVTFTGAINSGWTLDMRSVIAEIQTTSIKNQGAFLPELHEEFFDRITREVQDLYRLAYTFGIHGPDNEPTPWAALPAALARRGNSLMFDPISGLPTLGVPNTQTLTTGLLASFLGLSQSAAEVAAGVTPTNLYNWAQPWLWVRREGCVLDGVTDDTAAFQRCLAVAAALSTPNFGLLIDGPMFINTASIVIPQNVQLWFVGAGTLKPGAARTVTLGQTPVAGLWQIFDLSSGGLIAIPGTGNRISEVWCEWWGANGDAVSNLANDVAINGALSMLNANGSGGIARLGVGTFFTSGVINIYHETSLRGINGFTLIKARSSWAGGTRMINATRAGNLAMFWSRLEYLRIDANAQAAISQMIYGNAWQEKCGLFYCYLAGFTQVGFYYEHGYGGAAHMQLNNVEVFPNDIANNQGIFMTNDASVGFLKLEINQLTLANILGSGQTQNVTGMHIDNQILVCATGIDIEYITQGITLSQGAVLTGAGMSGGSGVTAMINLAGTWTGQVDFAGAKLGNATALVVDSNRAYAIAAKESIDGHLVWPPSQTRVVAGADILVSAGVASYGYQQGFSVGTGPNRTAAGSTTLTLATSMDGTSTYDVVATSLDSGAPIIAVNKASATTFVVKTFNTAGAATDAGEFSVKVFHKP